MSKENKLEEFIKNIEGTISDEDFRHWNEIVALEERLGKEYLPKGFFNLSCPVCGAPIKKGKKELGTRIVTQNSEYGDYRVKRAHWLRSCSECNYEFSGCVNSSL